MLHTIRISFIAFLALVAFLFISAPSRALESQQGTLVAGNADTLTSSRADTLTSGRADTLTSSGTDTLDAEESQRTRRQRLTDWMFVSRLDAAFSETEALESVEPFIPYEGRYIRKISWWRNCPSLKTFTCTIYPVPVWVLWTTLTARAGRTSFFLNLGSIFFQVKKYPN